MPQPPPDDDALLDRLQRETFEYFLKEVNPLNGLVADKTRDGGPASIAATGLALAAYPVGVERGLMTRDAAVTITLTTLRFFRDSVQGTTPDATGYKGFYYHFLDMMTGQRAWRCELSTVDTEFLLAGALTAAAYFERDTQDEHQIRTMADELYRRADWRWAQHGEATLTHGYSPRTGFLTHRWKEWVGVAMELRTESRADRVDDREPAHGPDLAAGAAVSLHRPGIAPGRVPRRLVMTVRILSVCRSSSSRAARNVRGFPCPADGPDARRGHKEGRRSPPAWSHPRRPFHRASSQI